MPVVVSVIFFLLFWVMSIIGEKISKDGLLPPEIGMWLGCLVFLPIGIWLTRKATADSAMFDSDNLFVRMLKIFKRRGSSGGKELEKVEVVEKKDNEKQLDI